MAKAATSDAWQTRRSFSIAGSLTAIAYLLTSTALANEFWLQPASFRVAVGAPVPLRLLVGTGFAGQPWPRPTRRTQRFVHLGPTSLADSTDLRPALLADSVAPTLTCRAPGTHAVVLTSALAFSELPPDKFTAYLRAQGLDQALLYRQQQGQTATKPGREAYRRHANLPLELVPEQNPYYLRPGAALTLRVLRHGQPVPGALVQFWDTSPVAAGGRGPTVLVQTRYFSTRANNNGRVLLRLSGSGPYLAATTYLEAAPAELAPQADWLSNWATLTFGGPGAPTDGPTSLFRK